MVLPELLQEIFLPGIGHLKFFSIRQDNRPSFALNVALYIVQIDHIGAVNAAKTLAE